MFHPHFDPPPSETVSQFVIPAKPRLAGREPGSRSFRNYIVIQDSGSRDTQHRSSGMTGFSHCDTTAFLRGKFNKFYSLFKDTRHRGITSQSIKF